MIRFIIHILQYVFPKYSSRQPTNKCLRVRAVLMDTVFDLKYFQP